MPNAGEKPDDGIIGAPPKNQTLVPLSRLVAWGATALVVLIFLCCLYGVVNTRRLTIAQAENSLFRISNVLVDGTAQYLSVADLVGRQICNEIEDQKISDSAQLRLKFANPSTAMMLVDKRSGVPQIGVAAIIDIDGNIVATSTAPNITPTAAPANLADRDYFKSHLANPLLESYLSLPVPNRFNGNWTFHISRKIRNPAGTMIGIVLIGIETGYFTEHFRSLELGENTHISLYRTDGWLIARYPEATSAFGRKLSPAGFEALRQARGLTTTSQISAVDPNYSLTRLVSARMIPGFPVMIQMTVAYNELLKPWYGQVIKFAILFTLIAGLTSVFAIWTVRVLRVQEKIAQESEREQLGRRQKYLVALEQSVRNRTADYIEARRELASAQASAARAQNRLYAFHWAMMGIADLQKANGPASGMASDAARLEFLQAFTKDLQAALGLVELNGFKDRTLCDLSEISSQAAEDMALVARAGGNQIMRVGFDGPNHVQSQSAVLKRCLVYLLYAACQTTKGGMISISLTHTADEISLCVVDNGHGFDARTLNALMQPPNAANQLETIGLGPYIVKKLSRVIGAEFSLESEVDRGTRYYLTFRQV
jgi:signal transduction histidine kinase